MVHCFLPGTPPEPVHIGRPLCSCGRWPEVTEEARRATLLTFGNTRVIKEYWRDQRTLPWLEELRADVRCALRGLHQSPAFTFVAVSCLALGVGANTALFSITNAVAIRALEVRNPGQLVVFSCDRSLPGRGLPITSSGYGDQSLPYGAFAALKEAQTLSEHQQKADFCD